MTGFDRISQQPGIMGGQACVRGLRVTVSMIVGMIGAGVTIENLLKDYSYLERDDVMQSLQYAAWRTEEREIQLLGVWKRLAQDLTGSHGGWGGSLDDCFGSGSNGGKGLFAVREDPETVFAIDPM